MRRRYTLGKVVQKNALGTASENFGSALDNRSSIPQGVEGLIDTVERSRRKSRRDIWAATDFGIDRSEEVTNDRGEMN